MVRMRKAAILGALLTSGCLSTTGSSSVTLNFDFTNPSQPIGDGWNAEVADVPGDRVADVHLVSGFHALPAPWAAYTGIEQGGTSVDGSLFVYHKKWISTTWSSGTKFTVRLSMTTMSNLASGCTTGPGTAVYLKAGISGDEPVATADNSGMLRLNLDKGTATSGGRFVHFGDITNGVAGCPSEMSWTYREFGEQNQPEALTIDADGGFWIFIGTQSTYDGSHDLYLLGITLVLTPTT